MCVFLQAVILSHESVSSPKPECFKGDSPDASEIVLTEDLVAGGPLLKPPFQPSWHTLGEAKLVGTETGPRSIMEPRRQWAPHWYPLSISFLCMTRADVMNCGGSSIFFFFKFY